MPLARPFHWHSLATALAVVCLGWCSALAAVQTCTLTVAGSSSKSLSCHGDGTVWVALSTTVYSYNLTGNVQVQYANCSNYDLCDLTFCSNTNAVFVNSSVSGATVAKPGVVCASGNSTFTWVGASFSGNRAQSAVLVGQNNDAITVTSCNFINNTGAIYTNFTAAVTAIDSVFQNNSSPSGPAIRISGGTVAASGSHFISNHAASFIAAYGVGGAPLYAGGTGGAIYAEQPYLISVSDSHMISNVADFSGGAIHVADSGNVSVAGSWLQSNSALGPGGGGAICALFSVNVTVADSLVSSNSAALSGVSTTIVNGPVSGVGGAIATAFDANVSLVDSTFEDNVAAWGAAVYMEHAVPLSGATGPQALQAVNCSINFNVGSGLLTSAGIVALNRSTSQALVLAQDGCPMDLRLCLNPGFSLVCYPAGQSAASGGSMGWPTSVHGPGTNVCVSPNRWWVTTVLFTLFGAALVVCVLAALLVARSNRLGHGNSRIGAIIDRIVALVHTKWGLVLLTLFQVASMVANVVTDALIIGRLWPSGYAVGYIVVLLCSLALASMFLHVRLVVYCGWNNTWEHHTLFAYRGLAWLEDEVAPIFSWVFGFLFLWPCLALLDIPILAMHSLSTHRWFSWLRVYNFIQLHTFIVALTECTFAVVVVTYLYWRGMSPDVQFFLSDATFVYTVGTSMLHMVIVMWQVCMAVAKEGAAAEARSLFWDLVWEDEPVTASPGPQPKAGEAEAAPPEGPQAPSPVTSALTTPHPSL